jgi:serine/threonine protein kinase
MFSLSRARGHTKFSDTSPLREHGVVARYALGRRLDDGRTNEIYEATCSGIRGRVVTRFLRRALTAGPEAARACGHDLAQLVRVRHRNMAAVLAFGVTPEKVPYLVREHVAGPTLRAIIAQQGPLDAERASALVQGIAAALAAAHDAGVIHGDLRPGKVFLLEGGGPLADRVKLVGFGSWRLTGDRRGPGVLAEPARFTSPELTTGEATVDGRSDQFALAAMTYYMLTGVHAFPGDDVAAVLRGVLTQPPRPLSEISGHDAGVNAVVQRGLAKRPADRYGSVLEFASALARAVTNRPAEATEPFTASEIRAMDSLAGALPRREMGAEIDETFFDVGDLKEVDGRAQELAPPYRGSPRRRPRRRGRQSFARVALLLSAVTAAAWYLGTHPPPW